MMLFLPQKQERRRLQIQGLFRALSLFAPFEFDQTSPTAVVAERPPVQSSDARESLGFRVRRSSLEVG
ncbi:hypothetical protein B5M44_22645 [Shinella sumterensis]|nr:hypothetical protein B5M44_22645 [Shinella sumterensis]